MRTSGKVIGIGAAGNKAAIEAIERGVIDRSKVVLLNSTLKDIPSEYEDISVKISKDINGCGKEREKGIKMMKQCLKDSTFDADSFLDPEDKMVVIVFSSEGGTGSGAGPTLARYFREVIGANVHTFIFTGFEADSRGLKNTIGVFKDMKANFVIEAISNKKFKNQDNMIKAEQAANIEFATRLSVLFGNDIIDSSQNIDETDHLKIVTTPGFMDIETFELGDIKNQKEFNALLSEVLDDSPSLDFEPSAMRIGVVFNVKEKTLDKIDFEFNTLKKRLGVPFELFTHIQYDGETEYMSIIASGIKMPIEAIEKAYDKYQETAAKVDMSEEAFYNKVSEMDTGNKTFDVDLGVRKPVDSLKKNSFFDDED